jgi:hypothetical protein
VIDHHRVAMVQMVVHSCSALQQVLASPIPHFVDLHWRLFPFWQTNTVLVVFFSNP